jgi:hypothetical protein
VTAGDAEVVQATRNLQHHIRHALGGQAQHLFDSPTPFDSSDHVFDHHPDTGEEPVAELFPHRELFALGLFGGCVVNPPPGSYP